MNRMILFSTITLLSLLVTSSQAQDHRFDDLIHDWRDDDSIFMQYSNFHGEAPEGYEWFNGYESIDIWSVDSSFSEWKDLEVLWWARGQSDQPWTVTKNPVEPRVPLYGGPNDTEDDVLLIREDGEPDLFVIKEGRFMVGAAKWPCEEVLEEWVAGTIPKITETMKQPVYWVVQYDLFIPAEYGKAGNVNNGKCIIVQSGGGPKLGEAKPPWFVENLDPSEYETQLAQFTAQQLRVPVMYISQFPFVENYWKMLGYTNEGKVFSNEYWSTYHGTYKDHPRYLFAPTYIRAINYLDGFFNPSAQGTAHWSLWDDLTNHQETSVNRAVIQGGSKRAHSAWIAALADDRIEAIISNGMGHMNAALNIRLSIDEGWEDRERIKDRGPESGGGNGLQSDEDQIPPKSFMSGSVDRISLSCQKDLSERISQYYDIASIIRDYDGEFPNGAFQVYHTQGAQDPYWPKMTWRYWEDSGIFPGDEQYYDFQYNTRHSPAYRGYPSKVLSFIEHVWSDPPRPMPTSSVYNIDFDLPIEGEVVPDNRLPLRVSAIFMVDSTDEDQWPLKEYDSIDPNDPQNFRMRLNVAMRPLSLERSRGVWSDRPRNTNRSKGNRQRGRRNQLFEDVQPEVASWDYGRQTVWWSLKPKSVVQLDHIPPFDTPVPHDTVAYMAEFEFNSAYLDDEGNDYNIGHSDPRFPEVYKPDFVNLADFNGVPEDYTLTIYVSSAVEHEAAQYQGESWRAQTSSPFEYLPPWKDMSGQ